jgi:hypothetical protein
MNKANLITIILVVAGAVLPYLIGQTDVPPSPPVKVALTAFNIAVVAIARLSNPTAPSAE